MSTTLPQKLYKFCPFSTQSLRLLTEAEAYYADPRFFNDPLDCKPAIKIDVDRTELERLCFKLLRRTRKREAAVAAIGELRYLSTEDFKDINDPAREDYLKRLLVREIERLLAAELAGRGVLSLSAVWDSPLMWSHYADQHRGICIEYDTSELSHPNIGAINYEASRSIKTSDLIKWKFENCPEAEKRIISTYFFTKASEWKYEKEWRDISATSGVCPSRFRITGVHFGFRCDTSVITTIVRLYSSAQAVDLYEIYPPDGGFSLQRQHVDRDEIEACGIRPLLPFEDLDAVPCA